MTVRRKLQSALHLFRREGVRRLVEHAQNRGLAFYHSRRPIPTSPDRRARLLEAMLNRWSGVSAISVSPSDVLSVRESMLSPYLRHHFIAVMAKARSLDALRPAEVAMLADSLLALWKFAEIAEALPYWAETVEGTSFAQRIDQTGRRAAFRLGRLSEAARELNSVGDDVGSLMLRADIYDALGHMDEARKAYEAAVRRNGSDAYVRRSHGFHLMKAGRVRDGLASWALSEALAGQYPLRRGLPHWTGEPLGSQRLMVIFEHGLGDMLQMARFLPRLTAREPEATVMGRVPTPLLGLMVRAFPQVRFVSEDEREPEYDVFVPSTQLGSVLEITDLEPCANYIDLGHPTARPALDRPRVGVCWRGHPRQYEATRSISLDMFAALFTERKVDFFVLLNRLTSDEAVHIDGEPNVFSPPIYDFVDLAALIASCDLIVTVDTAVVHLAGAGGIPTVLLSRPDVCWRWGAFGARGPWYDSVEVLRHGGDMDWLRLLGMGAEKIRALSDEVTRPARTS